MAKKDDKVEETVAEEPKLANPKENLPEAPKEETPPPEPEKPAEETPEEEPEEQEPPTEEEGEEQAPPQMSKRKAERLAKLENLVTRLKGDETPQSPDIKGMDYATELQADDETITRLDEDRKSVAQEAMTQGFERAKSVQFHTRLEIDAPRIESKYPLFDKDSEDFKPATVDAINRWYLASVGFVPGDDSKGIPDRVANPNLRYGDFVEGIMELSDSMAGVKVENTQKNIVKQAANTGLRPDGSTSKLNLNKAPQDMSDEELKTVLTRAFPQK